MPRFGSSCSRRPRIPHSLAASCTRASSAAGKSPRPESRCRSIGRRGELVGQAQHAALRAAGCERIFSDTASGKLAERPELAACLDYLRPGDTLVCTKLDRLGRSVKHLVDLVLRLVDRRVDLTVTDQAIDTATPGGKLLFHG